MTIGFRLDPLVSLLRKLVRAPNLTTVITIAWTLRSKQKYRETFLASKKYAHTFTNPLIIFFSALLFSYLKEQKFRVKILFFLWWVFSCALEIYFEDLHQILYSKFRQLIMNNKFRSESSTKRIRGADPILCHWR